MTKLNDASAIYYGAGEASRVYAGAAQAWPPYNPPGGYAYGLYNQFSAATSRYGCVIIGLGETPYGDLWPRKARGLPIARLTTQSGGQSNIRMGLDGITQVPGVATITLTFQGGPANVSFPWNGASSVYRAASPALYTYLSNAAQQNRVIGINGFPA